MESAEVALNYEDIVQRHRGERKDLQAKITALKKSIPKNDKKKKKEVADQIANMESDLEEKQKEELRIFHENDESASTEDHPNHIETVEVNEVNSEHDSKEDSGDVKITRAQRRRNKKENENKERNKRISEQEQINKKGPRVTELNTIKDMLRHLGLQIYNVPADGNCLYCSIKHQLEVTKRPSYDIQDLRKLTADFIRENRDDFIPFMCNDSDGLIDEEHFEKYCQDVATTKLWGGQLELKALSNVLKSPIKIIQATGPPTLQGEQYEGEPLTITYHRHLYRLGEHYNSTNNVEEKGS